MKLVDEKEFESVLNISLEALKLNPDNNYTYIEFGTFIGTSLIAAEKALSKHNFNFICFDSFNGLPAGAEQDSRGKFKEGDYKCTKEELILNLKQNNFPFEKLKIIEGYFKDTISTLAPQPNCKIFMFDCDLYSSTVDCLKFVNRFFNDDAIFIFDDWYVGYPLGQSLAYSEYLRSNKISSERLGKYKLFVPELGRKKSAGEFFYVKKS